MDFNRVLSAVTRARAALDEARHDLLQAVEARGSAEPDEGDAALEACEIALDELFGADSGIAAVEERLRRLLGSTTTAKLSP
jgi:hypothetical protein